MCEMGLCFLWATVQPWQPSFERASRSLRLVPHPSPSLSPAPPASWIHCAETPAERCRGSQGRQQQHLWAFQTLSLRMSKGQAAPAFVGVPAAPRSGRRCRSH